LVVTKILAGGFAPRRSADAALAFSIVTPRRCILSSSSLLPPVACFRASISSCDVLATSYDLGGIGVHVLAVLLAVACTSFFVSSTGASCAPLPLRPATGVLVVGSAACMPLFATNFATGSAATVASVSALMAASVSAEEPAPPDSTGAVNEELPIGRVANMFSLLEA